jgi:hypothetical protein
LVRTLRRDQETDWLGLGAASRLLGVSPDTLRRWSDAGSVHTFTTPGGHRRYRRSSLERLAPADSGHRSLPPRASSPVRSSVTPARLARAYRAEARSAGHAAPWLTALDESQRDWFRQHGRSLAQELLAHLDGAASGSAEAHLEAAATEAAAYGRMAASLGISLSQAVEGFLQFRRPFLHELVLAARRRDLDLAATTGLLETAERAMDQLLVATMSAHEGGRGLPGGLGPSGPVGSGAMGAIAPG